MKDPRRIALIVLVSGIALCFGNAGAQSRNADELLRHADGIKLSDYATFERVIDELGAQESQLTPTQKDIYQYLLGWRFAYKGSYQQAVTTLTLVAENSTDPTLRFRSLATIVNVTALAKQYELAFSQLRRLLDMLPKITDKAAREQGLSVTALLYNMIGEYGLALSYAKILRDENLDGRGACTAGQLELQALYKDKSRRLPRTEFEQAIAACEQVNEHFRANGIRSYAAKRFMDEGRYDEALGMLEEGYKQVAAVGSPQMRSEYEASFALSYRQTGNSTMARKFAMQAVESAVKNEHTEPLVTAYRILYLIAKEQGDLRGALDYHEKLSAADKGYLDDVTARQLAYQRVQHEVNFTKLQIESLNKENQVLQLERKLSDKAVENIRLYIVLLAVILAFIVFWAYRTKRSQLHFMKLSRRDGLTDVFNRPHFMELAERTLASCRSQGQEASVVVCDLDHFKKINDNFGHAAGDAVLKQASARFQDSLRKDDIVGRLGGEEFGIVLVNCDIATAQERCEQLRLAFTKLTVPNGNDEFVPSASFGVTTTKTSGYELRQLLADADAALYQAKRNGRNRVVQHREQQSQSSAEFNPNGHRVNA